MLNKRCLNLPPLPPRNTAARNFPEIRYTIDEERQYGLKATYSWENLAKG